MKDKHQLSATQMNELIALINEQHQRAEESITSGLYHMLNAGQALLDAKRGLPHGEFGKWVENNLDCSLRTAQRYMRAVKRWPEIQERAKETPESLLTLKEGLALIADRHEMLTDDGELVPLVGHMSVGTIEKTDGTVEIVLRPKGDGRWFVLVFGPFNPDDAVQPPCAFAKTAIKRDDIQSALGRLAPVDIDFDAIEWEVSKTEPGAGEHPLHRPSCEYRQPMPDDRQGWLRCQEERMFVAYQEVEGILEAIEREFSNQANATQSFDEYLVRRFHHDRVTLDVIMHIRRASAV